MWFLYDVYIELSGEHKQGHVAQELAALQSVLRAPDARTGVTALLSQGSLTMRMAFHRAAAAAAPGRVLDPPAGSGNDPLRFVLAYLAKDNDALAAVLHDMKPVLGVHGVNDAAFAWRLVFSAFLEDASRLKPVVELVQQLTHRRQTML